MAWLANYGFRKELTIASNTVSLSANVTNAVVTIRIPATETHFWANIQADGDDVRFTTSDGSTTLDFEIVRFDNTNDVAIYKVEIPTLTSASATLIYLYYGYASATTGEARTATWAAAYQAVYHLDSDASIGAFADSTGNAVTLTNTSTTDVATGAEGRCRGFARASSQYLSAGDVLNFDYNIPFSVFADIKRASTGTAQAITGKMNNAGQGTGWLFYFNAADKLICLIRADLLAGGHYIQVLSNDAITDTTNIKDVGFTYDGSSTAAGVKLYVNGAEIATTVGLDTLNATIVDATTFFCVGSLNKAANMFDGDIDEVELTNDVRTADQIKVRYNSYLGTWLTIGTHDTPVSPTNPVLPSTLTLTATLPDPTISSPILAQPTPAIATVTVETPDVNKVLILASPCTLTLTVPAPSVGLPSIVQVDPVTLVVAILDPDINNKAILFSVLELPTGKTVSYKIVNDSQVTIQDWTTVGVVELVVDATANKSVYFVKNNKVNENFQGVIMWKTSDATPLTAVETVNVYSSYVDILHSSRLTSARASNLDYLDGVVAKEATASFIQKWILNRLVESADGTTVTLYDDDNTTPLKTWAYDSVTKTRSKAT